MSTSVLQGRSEEFAWAYANSLTTEEVLQLLWYLEEARWWAFSWRVTFKVQGPEPYAERAAALPVPWERNHG